MGGNIAFAFLALAVGVVSSPAQASEHPSIVPSTWPNLDAERIANLGRANVTRDEFLVKNIANFVNEKAFKAKFDRQAAPFLAEATQRVNGGAQFAVIVCEIYTSPYGFTEVGPMTLVTGPSVPAALKQYSTTPSLSTNRTGYTESYSILVLSKSNVSAGFTSQIAPNESIKAAYASTRAELEAQAKTTRDQARETARRQAEAAAREERTRARGSSDGARGDWQRGAFGRGGAESKGSESKGSESKGSESKGSESKSHDSSGDGGFGRLH